MNRPRKHRSWVIIMMINRSNWPGGMRDSKHRWLRRLMPPFKKSSPSQAWLTWSSCCLDVSLLQFPFATWVMCWPLPCNRRRYPCYHHCTWARGLTSSWPLRQSGSSNWNSASPSTSLTRYAFVGTPPVGCPFVEFIAGPTQKRQDHSSSGSLGDHYGRRTHTDSPEIKARSEHSSTQAMRTCLNWY